MNIEVLAPIGSYKMVDTVLKTKCDAVYLGGIEFNMRMHSKVLNFTNEEIIKTVSKAHALNKNVYVTVNTWFDDSEVELMLEYLQFLSSAKVDAIIVQDYGVVNLIKKHNIDLEIHASVMMNCHNLQQVKTLEEIGISRFVMSREMPLSDVKEIAEQINSEIEYFVSGDMCSANGGICYFSGILFSKCANRGQCFKMCRWDWDLKYQGQQYESNYYLAAKDMDMVAHIDSLIENGVNSLKIEGRRKQVSETEMIINSYGEAVADYKANKFKHENYQDCLSDLYPRETSTAYAFGAPGTSFINQLNEGNPDKIRIFSKSGKEIPSTNRRLHQIKEALTVKSNETEISVRVDNFADAKLCLHSEVDSIYLSLESFNGLMSVAEMQEIIDHKFDKKVFLSLPVMQTKASLELENKYISELRDLDGIEVSDVGQIVKYQNDYEIRLNFNLNVMNSETIDFMANLGASHYMPSIEANPHQVKLMQENSKLKRDILVFGRLMNMYLDLNLYEHTKTAQVVQASDNKDFSNDILVLENKLGQESPVYIDNYGKNHLMSNKVQNLLPLYEEFKDSNLIVDMRFISQSEARLAIDTLAKLKQGHVVDNELTISNEKYFFGSLNHLYKGAKYVIVK